jgi:uncharacterized protein YukE
VAIVMSGALVRPGGDPDQIDQFAAQLAKAGTSTQDATTSISRQTAQVKEQAQWNGDAADAYTGFTTGLSRSVGALGPPLSQAAAPLHEFAATLRVAQQRVDAYSAAYSTAYPLLAEATSPAGQGAPLVDARLAGLYNDAQAALAAYDAQAGVTAASLGRVAEEMTRDFFGPDGPFRNFLDSSHLPWDAVAGDALIENFIKGGEEAESALKNSKALPETIEKFQEDLVKPVADEIEAGDADARTNLRTLLQAVENYQVKRDETIAQVEKALEETDPALAENLTGLKTVATEMDAIGFIAGVYAAISPPQGDKGAWRTADRFAGGAVAVGSVPSLAKNAFNVDFGDLSLGPLESLDFVPDVGLVVAVAGGIYMTVDWAVHHPQEVHYILDHPREAACNLIGNLDGKQIWEEAGCAPAQPSI